MNKIYQSLLYLFLFCFLQETTFLTAQSHSQDARSTRQSITQSDQNYKKYKQAKALEKAGLWEEAEKLFRELNTEAPGNKQFFAPLKSLLRNKQDYDALTHFIKLYLNANPGDISVKIDLGEVYILTDSTGGWQNIFSELLVDNPNDPNIIKMIVNKLVSNGMNDEASEKLIDYRLANKQPDFYSFEMANFYAIRMAFEKAIDEYLLYLSENPLHIKMVSDRILAFPVDISILNLTRTKLNNSPIVGTKLILVDLEFKNANYLKSYDIMQKIDPNPELLLAFGEDLVHVKEYDLAETVLNDVLNSGASDKILENAIFLIAQLFELRTTRSLYLLPISGFYRGNPFFSSPYLRVDESRSESLWKAITIYDSLRTQKTSASAALRLGELKFTALNDLDGARENFEEVIQTTRKNNLKLFSHLRIADILIAKGDLQTGYAELEKDLSYYRHPNDLFRINMKKAQIALYQGELQVLDSLMNMLLANSLPSDDGYNDILEISGLLTNFKNSPELFESFAGAQLFIKQNKRIEALKKLELLIDVENQQITHLIKYQIANLLVLQNETEQAVKIAHTITGESVYSELSLILQAEIEDFINNNISTAIDIYLQFLELYPTSIYYDDIRLRLRELAS